MLKIEPSCGSGLAGLAIAYLFTSSVWGNEAHDRLMSMSNSERNMFFTKFFNSGGESCQVVRNFYQGSSKKGDAFWNVACKGKDGFSIIIYNDAAGSTKILECRVMKAVGATPCFKKF